MMLLVDVRHRLGSFDLEARFETYGQLTALFGPSGSGKTSLINMIGGLLRPDDGHIEANGWVFVDTTKRIFVPKYRRRVGYVFQDARLFPHLTVAQNLRYGRWFTPAAERYADLDQIVTLLGIERLLDRRPTSLSGGEKQRVAIGRALAASPKLVLMDEPLASLDEARKAEILPYIERLRDELKIPIVYVSHSIAEVARLASDIVVLDKGKVSAVGPTAEIMLRTDLLPSEDRAEAGAVLEMDVVERNERFDIGVLRSAAGQMRVPGLRAGVGDRVRLRVRARDVMLALEKPARISGLNVLKGRVLSLEKSQGAHVDVIVDCNGQAIVARITRLSAEALPITPGIQVFAVVKSVSLDGSSAGPVRLRVEIS
ncbi:MAG: molybdenum ABC transporter ATP-binding protein [Rhizobiaceae bacterium]